MSLSSLLLAVQQVSLDLAWKEQELQNLEELRVRAALPQATALQ